MGPANEMRAALSRGRKVGTATRKRDRDIGDDQCEDKKRFDRSVVEIVPTHRFLSPLGGDFVLNDPAVE